MVEVSRSYASVISVINNNVGCARHDEVDS